jgi:hypothetical protein
VGSVLFIYIYIYIFNFVLYLMMIFIATCTIHIPLITVSGAVTVSRLAWSKSSSSIKVGPIHQQHGTHCNPIVTGDRVFSNGFNGAIKPFRLSQIHNLLSISLFLSKNGKRNALSYSSNCTPSS